MAAWAHVPFGTGASRRHNFGHMQHVFCIAVLVLVTPKSTKRIMLPLGSPTLSPSFLVWSTALCTIAFGCRLGSLAVVVLSNLQRLIRRRFALMLRSLVLLAVVYAGHRAITLSLAFLVESFLFTIRFCLYSGVYPSYKRIILF